MKTNPKKGWQWVKSLIYLNAMYLYLDCNQFYYHIDYHLTIRLFYGVNFRTEIHIFGYLDYKKYTVWGRFIIEMHGM